MQLIDRILNYDQHFNDSDYLDHIISTATPSELFSALDELLKATDPQILSHTLLFIQDMILVQPGPERQILREKYPHSSVVHAIEVLLPCNNYALRQQAVYVLGKTCSHSSVSKLEALFLERCDRDPLLLPRLMGELGWLGSTRFDEFIGLMMASPTDSTRWATLKLLPEFLDLENHVLHQQTIDYYQQLQHDPHPLIQREADYLYQLHVYNQQNNQTLPKATRRHQRQQLDQHYKPLITFDNASLRFCNHLYTQGFLDYSVEQFEAFVGQMQE